MKKIVVAMALTGALTLGACQGFQTFLNNLPSDLTNLASLVKSDVAALCQFEPAAETVAGIVSAYVPGAVSIEQAAVHIAEQVCKSVTSQSAKLKATVPTVVVNGKTIEVKGHFTK